MQEFTGWLLIVISIFASPSGFLILGKPKGARVGNGGVKWALLGAAGIITLVVGILLLNTLPQFQAIDRTVLTSRT